MLGGLRIKSAKRLLLEVPTEKPGDEVLGEARRRSCTERRTPQVAKRVDAERPNAVDLGLDRLPKMRGEPWQSGGLASWLAFPLRRDILRYDAVDALFTWLLGQECQAELLAHHRGQEAAD